MEKDNRVPLEDLMIAMDVVDTLRHREVMVDRELNATQRREKLIEKLREIYRSQGIDVSDEMLEDGVRALEEERFSFTPLSKNFSTKIAKLYVRREKWIKPVLTGISAVIVLGITYYMFSIRPQKQEQEMLPIALNNYYSKIMQESKDSKATKMAKDLNDMAKRALGADEIDTAKEKIDVLRRLLERINERYTVQIVQELGKHSGIWRVPPNNPYGKNYYLLVEGVNASNEKISVLVNNEENDRQEKEVRWGIRVDEETFNQVAQDKADDGIIQNRIVGVKEKGYLLPNYSIKTSGATITQW